MSTACTPADTFKKDFSHLHSNNWHMRQHHHNCPLCPDFASQSRCMLKLKEWKREAQQGTDTADSSPRFTPPKWLKGHAWLFVSVALIPRNHEPWAHRTKACEHAAPSRIWGKSKYTHKWSKFIRTHFLIIFYRFPRHKVIQNGLKRSKIIKNGPKLTKNRSFLYVFPV